MNTQQQIKKRTWEYFIQQKTKEITMCFIIIMSITLIPFILGNMIGDGESQLCGENSWEIEKCGNVLIWMEGFIYLIGLVIIGSIIYVWLHFNWDKAKKRARRDFK